MAVEELMKGKIDVGLISGTIIDESFSNQQFKIYCFKTIWRDRESLIFYIKEQIPSKILILESILKDIEIILLDFTV